MKIYIKFFWLHFLPFALLAVHMFLKPWAADEPEHMHYAYLVGLGLRPYIDFFQNHLPLFWYLLSPIAVFSGFAAKILFTKVVQIIILSLTLLSLAQLLPKCRELSSWWLSITLLLMSPFVDYLDLRPEFIAIPFVAQVTALMLTRKKPGMNLSLLLGILCGILVFFTPRVYPFILFIGLYMLLTSIPLRIKLTFVSAGLISTAIFLMAFDPKDMLFFSFTINRGVEELPFAKLHYNKIALSLFIGIMMLCTIDQLINFRSRGWLPFSMNLVLCLLWSTEKAPYMVQSTLFIFISNVIYLLIVFVEIDLKKEYKIIALGCLSILVAIATYKRNVYRKYSLFEKADFYTQRLRACDGYTYQARSIVGLLHPYNEAYIHPIFIRDYSYFGYFNSTYHDDSRMRKILKHNEGRHIQYIGRIPPCYMDESVSRSLHYWFASEFADSIRLPKPSQSVSGH
jgi:hypothetical protein